MAAIDVGPEAIGRASSGNRNYTTVDLNNPANETGELTSIEIWAEIDMTGVRVGTFYLVSGTTYKCRASQAISGTITAGSKVTKAVSLAVVAGDYIGIYFTGGNIEADWAGYSGFCYVSGEYIDPGDQAVYTPAAAAAQSLKGIGDTGEPAYSFGAIIN